MVRLNLGATVVMTVLVGCDVVGPGERPDFVPGIRERPVGDCHGELTFPDQLSEHTCMGGSPPRPAEDLIPYDVIAPLWSDGTEKSRYLALPPQEQFDIAPDGRWSVPAGGVLVKVFSTADHPLETRFLHRDPQGEWRAETYVWNEEGTDAELRDDGPQITRGGFQWKVPSTSDCWRCHDADVRGTIGLEEQQLARDVVYVSSGVTADQRRTLAHIGLAPPPQETTPLVPAHEADQDLAGAARSYLHANCAHCHRPGGQGFGASDMRYGVSLSAMGLCKEQPEAGTPVEGALITPGSPEESVLAYRMETMEPQWRMPPVGTAINGAGPRLVADWIQGLPGCEEEENEDGPRVGRAPPSGSGMGRNVTP